MVTELPGPDRLPPQNRDAERCVLGSMLRDNTVISDIIQIIHAENFYFDAHQKIFQAIVDIYDAGHPVDLVILAERLKQLKQIEDVGGYPYLGELWEAAPTAANAEYYARIVRDKGITRGLIHASTEILRDAYDQAQPADELLGSAERKILEIAEKGVTGTTSTLQDALKEAYKRLDQRVTHGVKEVSGLSTGFVDLDVLTAGLQNSELIILAARPSVGKTAFSLNLVRHIVVEEQAPVFFVSLEQAKVELAERLLAMQSKVDSHKIRKGHLNGDDMRKLVEAGDILGKSRLFIDDTPAQNMLRIAANGRRLKLRQGIRFIVIDYLQLIEPENRRDPRQEQVAQISRRLKFLARELEIPVMALAQVNRASEDRQDHRPRLSDLRESGCLAGDSLVTMADTGERVPIRDLMGKAGFRVWALDEVTFKLKPAEVSHAFATGRKPVFRLETRLGRTIRATGNHKFRTLTGWKRLDELQPGERLALPRVLSYAEEAANPTLSRASSPYGASDNSQGREPLERRARESPEPRRGDTRRVTGPGFVSPLRGSNLFWALVPGARAPGYSLPPLRGSREAERLGVSARQVEDAGAGPEAVALREGGQTLRQSDVYWDEICSITPDGEEEVFDLTVPGPANFIANDIIAHNSIEQDADTCLLLHRPGKFDGGVEDNIIEVIVAKQRNGPTGEVTLAYLKQYMRYENYAADGAFGIE